MKRKRVHLWRRAPQSNSSKTVRTYCSRVAPLPAGAVGWDRLNEVTCADCIDARNDELAQMRQRFESIAQNREVS